jgi:mono/diheme cytochrome c family protein
VTTRGLTTPYRHPAVGCAVVCGAAVALVAPAALADRIAGNPARGKLIFVDKCSPCHTLKAAGAHGHLGPNLDKLKPSYARVITQVTTGGTAAQTLPPEKLTFKVGELSPRQIRDVAAFVFVSTHRQR